MSISRQYDMFGAQNRQNDDKSSNLAAMQTQHIKTKLTMCQLTDS